MKDINNIYEKMDIQSWHNQLNAISKSPFIRGKQFIYFNPKTGTTKTGDGKFKEKGFRQLNLQEIAAISVNLLNRTAKDSKPDHIDREIVQELGNLYDHFSSQTNDKISQAFLKAQEGFKTSLPGQIKNLQESVNKKVPLPIREARVALVAKENPLLIQKSEHFIQLAENLIAKKNDLQDFQKESYAMIQLLLMAAKQTASGESVDVTNRLCASILDRAKEEYGVS